MRDIYHFDIPAAARMLVESIGFHVAIARGDTDALIEQVENLLIACDAAARADERERAAREADAEAEANRSWESRWAAIRIAAAIRSLNS